MKTFFIILVIIGIINQLFNIKNIKDNLSLKNDIKKKKEKEYIIAKHRYLLLYNKISSLLTILIFIFLSFKNISIGIYGLIVIITDYYVIDTFDKLNKLEVYLYIINIALLFLYITILF